MTIEQIDTVPSDVFTQEIWQPLIDFFWERYNKRYFDQIEVLQNHPDYNIRNNCGFLIASIDCILIETLEQYYSGKDESDGNKLHDPFYKFFSRVDAFKNVIKENGDAGRFAGLIRSGLLHQSKTKKASIINRKSKTPVLDWIDEKDKNKGFKLNRDKFHKIVFNQYQKLIDNIKKPENSDLRKKFKSKLRTLIE